MATRQEIKDSEPGFIQKYGVQYYFCILLYAAYIIIMEYHGKPALVIAVIYLLQYFGRLLAADDKNSFSKNAKYHNSHYFHMIPLFLSIFGVWIVLAYSWIRYEKLTATTSESILSAQALGLMIVASLNAGHELFHKKPVICQAIGTVHNVIILFSVYPIEHIYYHHKNVGTIKDPITSPKNFNLYSYTLRVVWTAYKFTYQYSKKIFWGCVALNCSYVGFLYMLALKQYDDSTLAFNKVRYFIIVGLIGLFLLEIVEYIEHYGLIFKEDTEGKKKIRQLSSWNSQRDIIFNWISFRYQRHSGHHVDAYKYYSTLDLTPEMPRFRFSFFEGMLLSLIPPLWYFIMNPYVDEQIHKNKVEEKHDFRVRIIKEVLFFALTVNLLMNSF